MYILGLNSDDKGTQLEQLTNDLLRDMSYVNIITNAIGSGGEEIDVRADFTVPNLVQVQNIRLICECKAHKSPLGTSEWLKFLGKIFLEELNTGERVHGCLIALNGVNGNVSGGYDDLKRRRSDIQLVSGDVLIKHTAKLYETTSIDEIHSKLSIYTERQFQQAEIAYYNHRVYWIIAFEGNEYSILNQSGDTIEADHIQDIIQLVELNTPYHPYINLQEESEAIRRSNLIQRATIISIINNQGRAVTSNEDIVSILKSNFECSPEEVNHAVSKLHERNLIVLENDQGLARIAKTDADDDFYDYFIEILKFMLSEIVVIDFLVKDFYIQHINSNLIEKIQSIQGSIRLSEEDIQSIIILLRLSPMALARSIHPIRFITQHRDGEVDERMNRNDVDYYMEVLYQLLKEDFNKLELAEIYFQHWGLREIETSQRILIKGKEGIVLNRELRDRAYIGPADESLGGGYVRVRLLDDAPEPWEMMPEADGTPPQE